MFQRSLFICLLICFAICISIAQSDNLSRAYQEKKSLLEDELAKREARLGVPIFIRVLKRDRKFEVYIQKSDTFELFKSYTFCYLSGKVGPKRRLYDLQVPEGIYHIENFDPNSEYLLSMRINYPNLSDKILGDKNRLGGNICIHGSCASVGCLPMMDDIKEIYILAWEANLQGQKQIPVYIFPTYMSKLNQKMLCLGVKDTALLQFWDNLQVIYDYFERHKTLPPYEINKQGKYLIRDR